MDSNDGKFSHFTNMCLCLSLPLLRKDPSIVLRRISSFWHCLPMLYEGVLLSFRNLGWYQIICKGILGEMMCSIVNYYMELRSEMKSLPLWQRWSYGDRREWVGADEKSNKDFICADKRAPVDVSIKLNCSSMASEFSMMPMLAVLSKLWWFQKEKIPSHLVRCKGIKGIYRADKVNIACNKASINVVVASYSNSSLYAATSHHWRIWRSLLRTEKGF